MKKYIWFGIMMVCFFISVFTMGFVTAKFSDKSDCFMEIVDCYDDKNSIIMDMVCEKEVCPSNSDLGTIVIIFELLWGISLVGYLFEGD